MRLARLNSSKAGPSKAAITALVILVMCTAFGWLRPVEADLDEDDNDDEQTKPDDSQLPSLWTAAVSGSYHVLYQLEMADVTQKIEEWASFSGRQFRLDLLDEARGRRTSFLTYGHTREMFRYQPFECSSSPGGTMFKELGQVAPLFIGHVWDDKQADSDAYYAYGLGPLWLRAYKDGQQVARNESSGGDFKYYDIKFENAVGRADSDKRPFKLRFHFAHTSKAEFVSTIDWFLDKDNDEHQVRARVLRVDYHDDLEALKLPLGYGCSRRRELDPALQIDIGLVLFHQGAPNQVALEVLTSSASDQLTDADSWINRRSGFKVVRMAQPKVYESTPADSFYAISSQSRERNKARRLKQVWWVPQDKRAQAAVYTIDQTTGQCTFDHQRAESQLKLTFGQEGQSVTIVMGLDEVARLFGDFGSYHLIDPGEDLSSPNGTTKFKNRIYEKRVDKFEVRLTDGATETWGPVSIVKQISTHSQYLDRVGASLKPRALHLSTDYEIKVMLFFFSDKANRLLHKAVLELVENHEVSLGYAHEQLDVSQCFGPGQREDLVLKYPMASVQLARSLEAKRETIKLLAAEALVWDLGRPMNPLQFAHIRPTFDTFNMRLQVSLLEVPSAQSFKLEPDLWLLEAPNLDFSERKQALLEVTASNSDICGQHCDFYNCFQFAYSPRNKSCRVALDPARVSTIESADCQLYSYFERRPPKPAASNTSEHVSANLRGWFYQEPNERPHFDLGSMVSFFEELVELDDDASDELHWLTLRVDLKPEIDHLRKPAIETEPDKVVALRPSSLVHSVEPTNEYSLEPESDETETSSQTTSNKTVRVKVTGSRQLRLEFKAALFDRSFASYTGETLEGVTYEACEQHCELQDCRSFAYCQLEETCQVSGQHQVKFLQSMSKVTPSLKRCAIYTLDQLSKFEAFGRVPAPDKLQTEAGFSEPASNEADCATACMDHQEFACQGFYWCRKPTSKCYLMRRGASFSSAESDEDEVQFAEGMLFKRLKEPGASDRPAGCNYFERAYLNQFDKFLGKQLSQAEVPTRISVTGSLQDCARRCLRSKCLAFDACASPPGSRSIVFGSQTCHLLTEALHRRQLIPNKRCTSFVVSDKSHFSASRLELIFDGAGDGTKQMRPNGTNLGEQTKADEEAELNENDANERNEWPDQFDLVGAELEKLEQFGRDRQKYASGRGDQPAGCSSSSSSSSSSGSTWLARVWSLSLGLALGSGLILAWNLAYARGWLERVAGNRRRASPTAPVSMSRLSGAGWRRMF